MRINGARATNQHSATMKKLAIGIDIGGINTAFGLVDENGEVMSTATGVYVQVELPRDKDPEYRQTSKDSWR